VLLDKKGERIDNKRLNRFLKPLRCRRNEPPVELGAKYFSKPGFLLTQE
jgi:hypothetical protein